MSARLVGNKPAFYSMFSLLIRMLSGPVAILFITTKLDLTEQGIYYTFISVGAIQFVFEMGFSTCLVQFLSGSRSITRKYSLIKLGAIFYIISVVLMFLFISIYSYYIFSDIHYDWEVYFFSYLVALCFSVLSNFLLLIDEGSLKVDKVYKTKMLSSILYTLVLMFSLYFNSGLFSLAFAQFSLFLITYIRHSGKLIDVLISFYSVANSKLRVLFWDVVKFQYKLSFVWIFGYFFWNSFTLYFFKFQSIELAGQFGSTNNVLNSLAFASASWLQTKRSIIGKMNTEKKYSFGFNIAIKNSIFSMLVFILLSVFFVISLFFMPLALSERFLSNYLIISFLIFRIFVMVQELVLIYARTFSDEPFYKFTVLNYAVIFLVIFSNVKFNLTDNIFLQVAIVQFVFSFVFIVKLKLYVNKYLLCTQ